jgi:hypothetical protein
MGKYRKPRNMKFDVFFQKIRDGEWSFTTIYATCLTELGQIFFKKKGFDLDEAYDSAIVAATTKGSS